jgi:hypothetical protein
MYNDFMRRGILTKILCLLPIFFVLAFFLNPQKALAYTRNPSPDCHFRFSDYTYQTISGYGSCQNLDGPDFSFIGYIANGAGGASTTNSTDNAKWVVFGGPNWIGNDWYDIANYTPVYFMVSYNEYTSAAFDPSRSFSGKFVIPTLLSDGDCYINADNCSGPNLTIDQPNINLANDSFGWVFNDTGNPATSSAYIQSGLGDKYSSTGGTGTALDVFYGRTDGQRQIRVATPPNFTAKVFPANGALQGMLGGKWIDIAAVKIALPGNSLKLPSRAIDGAIKYQDGTSEVAVNGINNLTSIKIYLENKNDKTKKWETNLTATGTFHFDNIPNNATYKLYIKEQKADNDWKDWVSKLNAFAGMAVGNQDIYISGEKIFALDDLGQFVMPIQNADLLIDIKIKDAATDLFEKAINMIIAALSDALKWCSQQIANVFNWANDLNSPASRPLKLIWTNVRNLSLSVLTLGILIIAFANILNFDIEKYGLNKMLPKLFIGVGLSYFSYFIASVLLEASAALQALLIGNGMGNAHASFPALNVSGNVTGAAQAAGNLIVSGILIIIAAIIAVVAFLYLLLIGLLRIVVITFLVVIAPFAYIMNILPFTEFIYKMWWTRFIKWVFMGPAIMFFLYLTNEFLVTGFGNSSLTGSANPIMYIILAAVGVVLAAMVPMQLGGEVIKGVQKAKDVARNNWGSKKLGITSFLDERKATVDARARARGQKLRAKVGMSGIPGTGFLTGAKTDGEKAKMEENYIKTLSEENNMSGMAESKLGGLLGSGNEYMARAAARELAGRKRLASQATDTTSAQRISELMRKDSALKNTVDKDHKDLYSQLCLQGLDAEHNEAAVRAAKGTLPKDWKGHQFTHAQTNTELQNALAGHFSSEESINAFMRDADAGTKAAMRDLLRTGAETTINAGIFDANARTAYASMKSQLNV